jgi:hypothetical protein
MPSDLQAIDAAVFNSGQPHGTADFGLPPDQDLHCRRRSPGLQQDGVNGLQRRPSRRRG